MTTRVRTGERGIALVTVVLVLALLFVLATALLVDAGHEQLAATNEEDYVQALAFAEAGAAWAHRVIDDAGWQYSDVLNGPNNASATDDYLFGLRDLSLTDTAQFTAANEDTASAIVTRDFGDGAKTYEAIRLPGEGNKRALVYLRVEDNFDDDAQNPANNVPLADKDGQLRVTAAAEYPVFTASGGSSVAALSAERGPARRVLRVVVGRSTPDTRYAFASNGDIDLLGPVSICGDCSDVHSNASLDNRPSNNVCGDGTCAGSFRGQTGGISGDAGGSRPARQLPLLSPYDNLAVPRPQHFGLLGCGLPTATDPGNSKYFALVADAAKGKVYKGYWDFTRARWTWRLIDDLNDSTDVMLDDCGRAPGDPNYGTGVSDRPGSGTGWPDEFYGFRQFSTVSTSNCPACGSTNGDASLCTLANNDFTSNRYYDAGSGTPRGQDVTTTLAATVPLPGSLEGDGTADWAATTYHGGGEWRYGAGEVFSSLYGAVMFLYAGLTISGNPGNPSGISYCAAAGCQTTLPGNHWKVSFLTYSDIRLSGRPTLGPANAAAGYWFQFLAGRDINISGTANAYVNDPCSSGCDSTAPAGIAETGGIFAAHEQIGLDGTPSIVGFMVAEDALDCSGEIDGDNRGLSKLNGTPDIYYDCNHPPNPWIAPPDSSRRSWQEDP